MQRVIGPVSDAANTCWCSMWHAASWMLFERKVHLCRLVSWQHVCGYCFYFWILLSKSFQRYFKVIHVAVCKVICHLSESLTRQWLTIQTKLGIRNAIGSGHCSNGVSIWAEVRGSVAPVFAPIRPPRDNCTRCFVDIFWFTRKFQCVPWPLMPAQGIEIECFLFFMFSESESFISQSQMTVTQT